MSWGIDPWCVLLAVVLCALNLISEVIYSELLYQFIHFLGSSPKDSRSASETAGQERLWKESERETRNFKRWRKDQHDKINKMIFETSGRNKQRGSLLSLLRSVSKQKNKAHKAWMNEWAIFSLSVRARNLESFTKVYALPNLFRVLRLFHFPVGLDHSTPLTRRKSVRVQSLDFWLLRSKCFCIVEKCPSRAFQENRSLGDLR